MISFVLRRLAISAGVLLGVSIITFMIAFVVPADPAVAMAGAKADPRTLALIRSQLGLDQPVYAQYARYLDRDPRGKRDGLGTRPRHLDGFDLVGIAGSRS
jgi:ABC-type dipeptide/oligopeptide/nickel transport system permease component